MERFMDHEEKRIKNIKNNNMQKLNLIKENSYNKNNLNQP